VSGRLNTNGDAGMFDNSDYSIERNDLAKRDNDFSNYLQQKFNQLNPIAPLTAEETDLNNPKNALKAWEVDNAAWLKAPEVNNDSVVRLRSDYQIKFRFYKENVSQLLNDGENIEPSDENEYYKLYNIFKYASIILDKKRSVYFVALGYRSWSMGKIELRNENLYASGSWYFDNPFLINLKSGAITILPAEEVF